METLMHLGPVIVCMLTLSLLAIRIHVDWLTPPPPAQDRPAARTLAHAAVWEVVSLLVPGPQRKPPQLTRAPDSHDKASGAS